MEHVDVEGVALDPLAAVEEAAERANGGVNFDAEGVLERVDGTHLVGDGADPADARDDVDDLVRRPPNDESLEVPRRFEDAERGLDDGAVLDAQAQRAFAFHPGDVRDVEAMLPGLAAVAAPCACDDLSAVHRDLPSLRCHVRR